MKMFRLNLSASSSERVLLIPFCLMVTPFSAFIGYCLLANWRAGNGLEWFIHSIVVDAFFTFSIFSGLGLIWGMFAPKWLESLIAETYGKVIVGICLLSAGLLCMMATTFLVKQ